MGLSKSFQLILLLVFGLLFIRVYTLEDQKVQNQAGSVRQNFIIYVQQFSDWTGNGEDLYNTFSKDNDFQFFQYTHNSDSSLNYTFGSLAITDPNIADTLFKVDVDYSFNFPDGRMQVRLSSDGVISDSLADLQEISELLGISYLVLMLLFALLSLWQARLGLLCLD